MSGRLCDAEMFSPEAACLRPAVALSTDVWLRDPVGYVAVCNAHLRQAITRGLRRSKLNPAGYRVPVMILPLDAE